MIEAHPADTGIFLLVENESQECLDLMSTDYYDNFQNYAGVDGDPDAEA